MEISHKLEQEQEVLLYILILELKEDWKSGLAVLEGPLGSKLAKSASYRNFWSTKKLAFHEESGGWEDVAILSKEELNRLPDQWEAYKKFIFAVKELKLKNVSSKFTEDEVESFLLSQQTSHPDLRGPKLAQMEFVSTFKSPSMLKPLLLDYFEKFGNKPVTFSDMAQYLSKLETDDKEDFLKKLLARYAGEDIKSTSDICRDVNVKQLARFCGQATNLSLFEIETEVTNLMSTYNSVQHLVADYLSTDIRPSDNYVLLASHLLWDLWQSTREEKYFFQCTSLLYKGLGSSPSNWQMKLMLIRIMNIVGAGAISHSLHTSLDIKHLMLDTLGWILGKHLTLCGQLRISSQHCNQSVKFYNHVNKDTADHIITAFRFFFNIYHHKNTTCLP